MAGESARAVARRKREKAERLLRDAERFERGADGEAETARALAALPLGEWFVMHDVRWPGRRFANIDHVVVGPAGVFVIDSKHWSGSITVGQNVLRQNGRSRERSVAAAADAALAVAELLAGVHPDLVRPVLCFVREQSVSGWAREVAICSPTNLTEMLQTRAPVLRPDEVRSIVGRLMAVMPSATSPVSSAAGRPSPYKRSRPVTPRQRVRPPRKAGKKGSSVLTAFAVIVGLLLFGSHVSDLVTKSVVKVVTPDAGVQLGDTLTVKGTAGRPPLELTAQRVLRTRATGKTTGGAKASRLTAVSFRIKNVGDRSWLRNEKTSFSLGAENYLSYPADSRFKRLVAGRLLPTAFELAPGHTIEGMVVFDVPREAVPETVMVRVGPGLPELIHWPVSAPS